MITLAEAKLHCRVDHDHEDDLIASLIGTAISVIEDRTGRVLVSRESTLVIDRFVDVIELPESPVKAVTSIRYLDKSNIEQLFADYWLDTRPLKAKLVPADGFQWPAAGSKQGGIIITYTVGYESLPKALKQAALLLIGTFYEHRESVSDAQHYVVPGTVKMLIEPYRILRVS
jgi:uncharacterized phiE125 gp8 family phage protein